MMGVQEQAQSNLFHYGLNWLQTTNLSLHGNLSRPRGKMKSRRRAKGYFMTMLSRVTIPWLTVTVPLISV
jgi:hypothetical protein